MENKDTGLLLDEHNIKIQRIYFDELVRLKGINVIFRSPKEGTKNFTTYAELDTHYNLPVSVGVIYEEDHSQRTMKKLGWNTELEEDHMIISVPYDLKGLQYGALFVLPAGLDHAEGRVFQVVRMSNISIYPASIACDLGPVWESTTEEAELTDFTSSNFNLLVEDEE